MKKNVIKDVKVSIQVLPAHRFVGIRSIEADNYCDFWAVQEKLHGTEYCNTICGLLESFKSHNGQVGGWFYENGKRGYLYGVEVSADYNGEIPDGMECTFIPESLYAVFHYPPYDYDDLDVSVYSALREKMDKWDPAEHGFEYNDSINPTYQRHDPANYGQAFCRPVKKV